MPAQPDTRLRSEDLDDSIVVLQDDSSDIPTSEHPPRQSRLEMDAASNSDAADDRDDRKFEIQITSGAERHLPLPMSGITGRDPNAPLALGAGADAAKSRKAVRAEDMITTEAPTQPRGRKRKALTEEERQRSNLMRRLGACDSCRKRKLAVRFSKITHPFE